MVTLILFWMDSRLLTSHGPVSINEPHGGSQSEINQIIYYNNIKNSFLVWNPSSMQILLSRCRENDTSKGLTAYQNKYLI